MIGEMEKMIFEPKKGHHCLKYHACDTYGLLKRNWKVKGRET